MHSPRSVTAKPFLSALASLPKAELHVHLEGAIAPATVVELAALSGDTCTVEDVSRRYAMSDFRGFIEAYKWVTSYLKTPADYALITARLGDELLARNVVYAEVTLSVGVMLLRRQDVAANFANIREAGAALERRGLKLRWIFDAVRQFGPEPATAVARQAASLRTEGVVAFGMGGDETAIPASRFQDVYQFAAAAGLHLLIHAGEIGGPDSVRDAVTLLGAERIGHGIAAARDPELMALLADRAIPLEICPTSNLRTGALARQTGIAAPEIRDHPLPQLLRAGVPIALSTDDPAMFETNLNREYATLREMGLEKAEVLKVAEGSFSAAFLPAAEKAALVDDFRSQAARLELL